MSNKIAKTTRANSPKWFVVGLAFFLGVFGVHDFVVGRIVQGFAHLLIYLLYILFFLFPPVFILPYSFLIWLQYGLMIGSWIWAIIEGVRYDPKNPTGKKVKKQIDANDQSTKTCVTLIKVFKVIMYVNTGIIAVLFLLEGLPWVIDYESLSKGGAGTVMAFFYLGPVLLIGIASIILFLIPSVVYMIKHNYELIEQEYKKCGAAFGIEFLASIFSLAILFIH